MLRSRIVFKLALNQHTLASNLLLYSFNLLLVSLSSSVKWLISTLMATRRHMRTMMTTIPKTASNHISFPRLISLPPTFEWSLTCFFFFSGDIL